MQFKKINESEWVCLQCGDFGSGNYTHHRQTSCKQKYRIILKPKKEWCFKFVHNQQEKQPESVQCDKCKQEITQTSSIWIRKMRKYYSFKKIIEENVTEQINDLCQNCYEKYKKWMEKK